MIPMSLARVTIRATFGEGSGCEPLATGGDPLPQLGVAHGEAVEKETVGTTHHLRRDGLQGGIGGYTREDGGISLAYYIPYIYVTNDAALAAGRELVGAPKKLGRIELSINDYGLVVGTLDRGGELMRVEIAIASRLGLEQLDAFKALIPRVDNTITFPLLSLRVLPPLPDGTPGIAQLILWYAKFIFIPRDNPQLWAGEARVKLDGTPFDPLDDIKITQVITGLYLEGDMELGITRMVKEWKLSW
jgi:Acetoacetate decarboxylase